jgi:hypothetical protein
MRRAISKDNSADFPPTSGARLTFLAIDRQRSLKIAALPIDVDIEIIE